MIVFLDICESKSTELIDVLAAVRRKDFTALNCMLQYGIENTPEDNYESASQIKTTKLAFNHLINDNKEKTYTNSKTKSRIEEPGYTALSWAAKNGHKEVIYHLLNHGAKVDIKNNDGWTPLILAARFGHANIVKTLIENGADVNATTNFGETALFKAVDNGHVKVPV